MFQKAVGGAGGSRYNDPALNIRCQPRNRCVKKAALSTTLAILLLAGTLIAQSAPRDFISNYETMDLDFLRSHYMEIDNGRPIKIEGSFSSYQWLQPYQYQSRLSRIGLDARNYNLVQMTI